MNIKLLPAPQEGIHKTEINRVQLNNKGKELVVTFKFENGDLFSKSYYIKTPGGLAALTYLVKACLGDVEDFDTNDLIGHRVMIELKREAKNGQVYTNIKKVTPFVEEQNSDDAEHEYDNDFEEDIDEDDIVGEEFDLDDESEDAEELDDLDLDDDNDFEEDRSGFVNKRQNHRRTSRN